MRSVTEHQQKVDGLLAPGARAVVPLTAAAGRVLATDVTAPVSLPGFDNSGMDGYAVRAEDVRPARHGGPVRLKVEADIPAGREDLPPLVPGTAHRIMTGAPLPPGADAVVPVEATDAGTDWVEIRESRDAGAHVRPAGSDVVQGESVLTAGVVLGARQLGLLAGLGVAEVTIVSPLRVLVVSTGSELGEPGVDLKAGQLHNSNGVMLSTAVAEAGAAAEHSVVVADDEKEFIAAVEPLARDADLVITSGGVSAGAYEVVKDALTAHGVEFVKVAMQPGMPQGTGRLHGTPVVCLPGNPVSALVSFEMFVRPALRRAMGCPDTHRPTVTARLEADLDSPAGKVQLRRASLDAERGSVAVVGPAGSHHLRYMAQANCLVVIPADVTTLRAGDAVDVQML